MLLRIHIYGNYESKNNENADTSKYFDESDQKN